MKRGLLIAVVVTIVFSICQWVPRPVMAWFGFVSIPGTSVFDVHEAMAVDALSNLGWDTGDVNAIGNQAGREDIIFFIPPWYKTSSN